MFRKLMVITFVVMQALYTQAQNANADKDWKELQAIFVRDLNAPKPSVPADLVERAAQTELTKRLYREKGLLFWQRYPKDSRRYDWFASTMQWPVHYWQDPKNAAIAYRSPGRKADYTAAIDIKALQQWEYQYEKMRENYLVHQQQAAKEKGESSIDGKRIYRFMALLAQDEIWQYLTLLENTEARKFYNANVTQVFKRFRMAAVIAFYEKNRDPYSSPWASLKRKIDWYLISNYPNIGFSIQDLKVFLQLCINDADRTIREYGEQKSSLFALIENPFQLKATAMDGSMIDLEQLKGKVVLLDFWGTSCASCVAMMPRLKAAYEQYQKDGFEVLSICINPESDKEAIQKIKDKIGTNWPTLIIGGKDKENRENSLFMQIWKKYGFLGVPQLLLLDRKGKLIMYNSALSSRYGVDGVIKKAVYNTAE